VNYCRKRRVKKFLEVFPQAIDIIVRGIKAGIPLGDCFRNIAVEGEEPVKTEFRYIVDTQSLGLTIPEAVERIVERVPTPEASFFSIVITIQAKAGGNLAEALANLSNVLRDRKKMKGKIKAMSAEAKASAGIIGALPFLVAFFVYLTSPAYISLLFTTSTGNMVLGCCAFWMGCGVFVMNKMINFDM
jgi:tight adherence protein B